MANDPTEPKDLISSMKVGLSALFSDPRSPEAKLLEKRDKKRRNLRMHARAFMVVNGGLGAMNVLVWLTIGWSFPWALFPALMWGMGLTLHGLGYRSWRSENEAAIAEAERKLGRLPPGVTYKALPAPKDAPVIEGVTIREAEWIGLVLRARAALARAHEALDAVDKGPGDTEELRVQLDAGLVNLEKLAAGAERIGEALLEIAPDAAGGIDDRLRDLDRKIAGASDDLKEVYRENRAILVSRKEKLASLGDARARMKANAEGFLLAAENVRLDIAALGSGEAPKAAALVEPVRRLTQEVEILRKVEAELKQFS